MKLTTFSYGELAGGGTEEFVALTPGKAGLSVTAANIDEYIILFPTRYCANEIT